MIFFEVKEKSYHRFFMFDISTTIVYKQLKLSVVFFLNSRKFFRKFFGKMYEYL